MTAMTPGRWARLLSFAVLLAAAVIAPLLPRGTAEGAVADRPTAYQRQLTAQVQDPAGAPRAGADPARQRQGSLTEAAGRRQGPGTRTDRPAAGVRTGTIVRQPPATRAPGVTSGGCAVGYGAPGASACPPADRAIRR